MIASFARALGADPLACALAALAALTLAYAAFEVAAHWRRLRLIGQTRNAVPKEAPARASALRAWAAILILAALALTVFADAALWAARGPEH